MVSAQSKSTAVRAFKNQQQSERSKSAAAAETRTKEQQLEMTTKEVVNIINSKFTSQIKENQSWSQSKTQTLLLLQYPLPHQYPDLFESIDYNRSHKLSYMANTNENLFVQITSMGIQ